MKAQYVPILISVAFVLAAFTAWTISAQGPQPPEPGLLPPQIFSTAEPLPLEPESARLTSHIRPENQITSIPLGQPGLSFRYLQLFGTTIRPYISDTQHLNFPTGLFIDNADNLYVTEQHGARVLKFRTSDRAVLLVIGEAGIRLGSPGTLVEPRDVATDPAGNIWIADGNVVYQYDSAGRYTQQIGEARGSDNMHFASVSGVAFDSAGRLYVSDMDNHRIQIYTFSGGQPVYYATIGVTGQPGSDNSHFKWPARIAIDSSNQLYIADQWNCRVQRCVHAGGTTWNCSTFHGTGTCGSGNDQLSQIWGLGIDRNNNVYIADTWNGRIKKCNSSGYCTIFATNLNLPTDVAVDSAGNVYIANAFSFTVLKYNSSGTYQGIFAGVNGMPYLTDDQHLNGPTGIAVDASGNIYITEGWGYRLLKLDPTGKVLWRIGTPGIWGRDNYHFGSLYEGPADVAVGPTGRVYVADPGNYRVQVYDSNGNYITTLGGTYGTGNYQFSKPWGLAVDSAGNLYVVDVYNHRVQVYDSNLVYRKTLGVTGVAGSDNAHFFSPYGVAVDQNGNIYVADDFNNRVQVFNKDGIYVRTLGVTGEPGFDFGHFLAPIDVAVDLSGRIYVMDWYRVQVFDQNGAYLTTIGGYFGTAFSQFNGAYAVTLDSAGNLYVADTCNHRIQKFAPGVPGWVQVNINGFGDPGNHFISALEPFNGYLYAGTRSAQVWRTADGRTWSQVTPSGWSGTAVFDAVPFGSYLYLGTNSENGGEIWRTDGINWTRVVSAGFGITNNYGINALAVFSDVLYAATCAADGVMQVYRSASGDPGTWTPVVTDGFGRSGVQQDVTMDVYNGYLYLGLGRNGVAELWRSNDGVSWTPVFTNGLSPNNTHVSAMAEFNGSLYIGLRNVTTGGEVWRSTDGLQWTPVITGGMGNPSNQRPYGLIVFGNHLYLVFSNLVTGAEVWRSADGTTWERLVEMGWGDSNNYLASYFDKGAAVFKGRLFIGTSNVANGGEVWMLLHRRVYLPLVLRNR